MCEMEKIHVCAAHSMCGQARVEFVWCRDYACEIVFVRESHRFVRVCVRRFNSISVRVVNSLRLCHDSLINDLGPDLKQQATG